MLRNVMKLIGTHNGTFHCDEVLACSMLKRLPQFSDAKIIRTRDPEQLKNCDVVVDVGGEYNPSTMRFDHHQRSFDLTLKSIVKHLPYETKLSSAGLVYAHFGRDLIREILKLNSTGDNDHEFLLNILFKKLYAEFVEEIDAHDNGTDQYCNDIKPKFLVTTTLSNRVAGLNPPWNDKSTSEHVSLDPVLKLIKMYRPPGIFCRLEQFEKAMNIVGSELVDKLNYFYRVWWPARSIVQKSFQSRMTVDESGEIMILHEASPWKEHLFDIELDANQVGAIKCCTFYDERNDYWMIRCVPIEPKSFKCRVPSPENWRALRDKQLSNVAEIENCIFVHASGFCGANKTKEGALAMIIRSLNSQRKQK